MKNHITIREEAHHEEAHADAHQGEATPWPQENDGAAALMRLSARYNLPMGVCQALVADVLEEFGHAGAERKESMDVLEAARALNARFRLAMHVLISYQANQKTAEDIRNSTRVMAYVLGFKTAAGADEIAALARILGVEKATLNKCKLIFREKLGLPKDENERGEEARENMSGARGKQLKGESKK